MNTAKLVPNFEDLSTEEKIDLVLELWDQIGETAGGAYLTDDQKQELDRRLENYRANPDDVVSWDELRTRLRSDD